MKIGYLCKKQDACWWIRVFVPMTHLVLQGHEVKEEFLEILGYCKACGGNHTLEYQFFHEGDFKCPRCNSLISNKTQEWKDKLMHVMEWADLLVFQRTTDLDHLRLMKMAQDMGKPIVLEGDDDYINVPTWNPGYPYYAQRQGFVKEMYRIANGVTVTTPGLKQVYAEFNDNITVIPNCNDIEVIDSEPTLPNVAVFSGKGKQIPFSAYQEARVGKKVIGWGGSPTHEKDLEILIPAIKKLLRREPNILFGLVGFVHKAMLDLIPPEQIFLFSLVPVSAYFMLYKTLAFDVGLAPVAPFKFNEGKSSNKLIEYQILKVLPVASDFVTYKNDIHQGFLASPNTESIGGGEYVGSEYGWFRAISHAINCEDREERVVANRLYAEQNYDIKTQVHQWSNFFQKVLERTS